MSRRAGFERWLSIFLLLLNGLHPGTLFTSALCFVTHLLYSYRPPCCPIRFVIYLFAHSFFSARGLGTIY